ncbi:hypothetical protein AgCh_007494 [Apium graveolens]
MSFPLMNSIPLQVCNSDAAPTMRYEKSADRKRKGINRSVVRETVWPPMVTISNKQLDKDENGKQKDMDNFAEERDKLLKDLKDRKAELKRQQYKRMSRSLMKCWLI